MSAVPYINHFCKKSFRGLQGLGRKTRTSRSPEKIPFFHWLCLPCHRWEPHGFADYVTRPCITSLASACGTMHGSMNPSDIFTTSLFTTGYLFFWGFAAFVGLTPFFIWMQLRQVIKLLKAIRDSNERIADNIPSSGQQSAPSSVKYIPGING